MPRLLHDIIHAILSTESDIEIEAGTALSDDIGAAETLRDADVMIVAAPGMTSVDYESVLYAHPRLRLVAIAGDGRGAEVYELHPSRVALGEFSPQVLVDAIRAKPMSGSAP
jgi:hypothetical protein